MSSVVQPPSCQNGFGWMSNGEGQGPCLVTAWLIELCENSTSIAPAALSPLESGSSGYLPPNGTSATSCSCSWAVYNTIQACTVCQSFPPHAWTDWKTDCDTLGKTSLNSYWPSTPLFANVTHIPRWAILNPAHWDNETFDSSEAQAINAENFSDATDNSFAQPPLPSSSSTGSSTDSHSSTPIGAIVGGVIGGLIALALLGAGLYWWILTRRRRQRASSGAHGGVGEKGWGAGGRVDLNAGETGIGPGGEPHQQQHQQNQQQQQQPVREQERGGWGGYRHGLGLAAVISPFVHHDDGVNTATNGNGNMNTNGVVVHDGREHTGVMQRWHSHRDYTSSRTRTRPPVTRTHRSAASDPTNGRAHGHGHGTRSRSGSRESHGRSPKSQSQSHTPSTSTSTSPVQVVPSPSQGHGHGHGQSSSWAGHANANNNTFMGAMAPSSSSSPDGNGVISVAYRVPSRDAVAAMASHQNGGKTRRKEGGLPPGAAAAAMPGSGSAHGHGQDGLMRAGEEGWGSTVVAVSHEDRRRRRASDVLRRGLSLGRTRRPEERREDGPGEGGGEGTGQDTSNNNINKRRKTGGRKRGRHVVMNPASDAGSASGLSDGGEEGGTGKSGNDLLRRFRTPADVAAHVPGARLPNARDRAHPPPHYDMVTANEESNNGGGHTGRAGTLAMNVERLGGQSRNAEGDGEVS